NADDLAKKMMVADPAVKQQLTETFGTEAFYRDGTLNRLYLAEQAFEKERVNELNEIVHPRMPGYVQDEFHKAEILGYTFLAYEAALLFQNAEAYSLDYIVLIIAEKEKRIRWVGQRNEISANKITERIKKQPNFDNLTSK